MNWPPNISLFLLLLSALCGCGPSTPAQLPVFPVQGLVVFQSQPVVGATITFYKDGATVPSSGVTDANGVFRVSTYAENDGAVAGKHRVTVSLPAAAPTEANAPASDPPKAIADLESPEYQAGMQKVLGSSSAKKTPTARIPARYASIQSTDLEVEVRDTSKNIFELRLHD